MGLFEEKLAEVTHEGVRYILRRNPERVRELTANREAKLARVKTLLNRKNLYLAGRPGARVSVAQRDIAEKVVQLKIDDWAKVETNGRALVLAIEDSARGESPDASGDGCYVIKTDLMEKAVIYWGDETGLRSDYAAGRSYGRRGQMPVILGTGQRFGCNMISAITNRGRLNFMVFQQRFDSDVFFAFLRRLLRQIEGKVFLIIDGHPVHHAIKVKNWVQKHAHPICLFYLPGYSPELNPDELVNHDVKSNAVGRRRARNQQESRYIGIQEVTYGAANANLTL